MIYIYCKNLKSYGIRIILDNLMARLSSRNIECKAESRLSSIPKGAYVIPYTLDQAYETIKMGYEPQMCLLMDALTLGYRNKIWFYLSHFYFLHYDFFYCVYNYFASIYKEIKVVRKYKKIILVSQTDINYLSKFTSEKEKFICMPNGVELVTNAHKIKSTILRLGILSSWNHVITATENDWFITRYFPRLQKAYPEIKLYLAGRGPYINKYKGMKNVIVMGEIDSLDEFFSNIDIFIAANPKGCGILNRVLDAFAHKTFVLGHVGAFSGFRYMKDSYMDFSNYKTFKAKFDEIISNPQIRERYINNAFSNIIKYNNWETNISRYIEENFKENI